MASPIANMPMSEDAYFEMLEEMFDQPEREDWNDKYEYWNGVVVVNAGTQSALSIRVNIFRYLFQQLRGRDCQLWGQAVKLAEARSYVYPRRDGSVRQARIHNQTGYERLRFPGGKPGYIIERGIECLLNPSLVVE